MPLKPMNGTSLLIQISDGGSPETFAHDCLINTERGIQFASETNRQVIPECEGDPDQPAWSVVSVDGLSATIPGSGMLNTSSVPEWFAWFRSGASKNVRVLLNGVPAADGGGHWAGAFKLTGWEVTGTRNEKATSSVTLESDGPVAWVDAV
ncbi:phage tail tube protein [Chelativorans sp.]|uniref:phage tail tube protein n=1 Tax=Chelativorans sp. TaxID=2203393 RepID=UPI002812851F|nr:phage tail tube protein [Chelativorans sp.]